jgi:predicted PurR-regulated permease PerM
MSRMVSFIVLVAIILAIGLLFFRVMAGFLVPLFLAGILVVMFRPVHEWMKVRCHGRQKLAALLTTTTIILIVLVPSVLITTLAVFEGLAIARGNSLNMVIEKISRLRAGTLLEMPMADDLRRLQSEFDTLRDGESSLSVADGLAILQDIQRRLEQLERRLRTADDTVPKVDTVFLRESLRQAVIEAEQAVDRPPAIALEYRDAVTKARLDFRAFKLALLGGPYRAWLREIASEKVPEWIDHGVREAQSWLLSIGGATTGLLIKQFVSLAIMVIAIYFFFADGPKMLQTVMRLSPLDDAYEQELLDDFDRISRAVVVATLLSAAAQGLLAGIGFWFAGVDAIFLLVLLTTVVALIPFVGAAAVWVPVCLWLYFYEGRIGAAIMLASYGATIVSLADNVIKPWVLHGQSRLHPLLALLSVLGGVQALGPIGILVGPMIVVFLQTLLNILHREMTTMDRQRKRGANSP